nr:MAG TPA: hypothetical protein [Caudoviricetes sp.]
MSIIENFNTKRWFFSSPLPHHPQSSIRIQFGS